MMRLSKFRYRLWLFISTSTSDHDVNQLLQKIQASALKITYATFSRCLDDTGKAYIQGFMRTPNRHSSIAIKKVMGNLIQTENPPTTADIIGALTRIRFGDSIYEYGVTTNNQFEEYIYELESLKQDIQEGVSIVDISETYPTIWSISPRTIAKATGNKSQSYNSNWINSLKGEDLTGLKIDRSGPRVCDWLFTIRYPTLDNLNRLNQLRDTNEDVSLNFTETNTPPSIKGLIRFRSRKRSASVIGIIGIRSVILSPKRRRESKSHLPVFRNYEPIEL